MKLNRLTAVGPVDGRYGSKTECLAPYFSEWALVRYRVKVEAEYFRLLWALPLKQLSGVGKDVIEKLCGLAETLSVEDAERVKTIEKTTNHDVKAVEYFLKEKLTEWGVTEEAQNFVHFGLTSQDVNNTAFPLMLKDALQDVYLPLLDELIGALDEKAREWANVAMLARTHGQPASPTRLGKELEVFAYRLRREREALGAMKMRAKFGGATGNMNAHKVSFPDVDWRAVADKFVGDVLGLEREQVTTQISNYDGLAETLNCMARIGQIVVDLDRDIWLYISMGYFGQKIKAGEVGSSAMPHKVNPIDFENSEGNMGIAGALLGFLAMKLPVSRLQRDLTDSTVLRNVGVPMAHQIIAFESTLKGLGKLLLHKEKIDADLENEWAVVAEAIQTILRREGYPHPYETLKALTRTGEKITEQTIANFIETLEVGDEIKEELHRIRPENYLGY